MLRGCYNNVTMNDNSVHVCYYDVTLMTKVVQLCYNTIQQCATTLKWCAALSDDDATVYMTLMTMLD